MKARLTYIPIEVAEQFDDFIIQKDEQILNTVKARTKDFSTLSLLKLLYQVKTKEMSFSELYSKSNGTSRVHGKNGMSYAGGNFNRYSSEYLQIFGCLLYTSPSPRD